MWFLVQDSSEKTDGQVLGKIACNQEGFGFKNQQVSFFVVNMNQSWRI